MAFQLGNKSIDQQQISTNITDYYNTKQFYRKVIQANCFQTIIMPAGATGLKLLKLSVDTVTSKSIFKMHLSGKYY